MNKSAFRIYPYVFIPLLGLIYYSTFFMMSKTTDASNGFDWVIVLVITLQFASLWIISQLSINHLLARAWKMNLRMFIFGVIAIVILNNILFFSFRTMYLQFNYSNIPLFSTFTLTLNTLEGLLKGILILSMLFSLKFFNRWKTEFEENERLKRNELELQNRALKSQLNPHFLFNNLNTLSGLIHEDQSIADEFLKEMSQMYRYILKTSDLEIVPLEDEIKFASNYNYLLNKRFGKNYNYTVDVNDNNYVLPPISLHILLENVIKHNIIDNEHPMTISINENDGFLLVKNTFNPKNHLDSTKKGLKILKDQFTFLTNRPVEIRQNENEFIVKLPLLKIKK